LTNQLATLDAWEPKQINERQKALASLAVKAWSLSAD